MIIAERSDILAFAANALGLKFGDEGQVTGVSEQDDFEPLYPAPIGKLPVTCHSSPVTAP